jgi:molybdopterin converting factor small subunit
VGIHEVGEQIMSVEVELSSMLARYTNNQLVAKVKGSTVGECLNNLVKQFPKLKKFLFNKQGKLSHIFDIYVNGESAYPEELAKPVEDGDKLNIVFIIYGG